MLKGGNEWSGDFIEKDIFYYFIFYYFYLIFFFFFQAEDGIRDRLVTGVQTCALPIYEFDEDTLHMRQLLKSKLSELGLSVRALNCLKTAEVQTLGELVSFNKSD